MLHETLVQMPEFESIYHEQALLSEQSADVLLEPSQQSAPMFTRQRDVLLGIIGTEFREKVEKLKPQDVDNMLEQVFIAYSQRMNDSELVEKNLKPLRAFMQGSPPYAIQRLFASRSIDPERNRRSLQRHIGQIIKQPVTQKVPMAQSPTRLEVVEDLAENESAKIAACIGKDPEIFFPRRGDITGLEAAKTICRSCVIRDDCLNEALSDGHDFGVWGEHSEGERRSLQRRRRYSAQA